MENDNKLKFRPVGEIPPPYRDVFSEFPFFNTVQSCVLDEILYTDNSMVVSAPTGSGKTTIFELAIIRILMQYEGTNFLEKFKIIYISPIKALCQEKLNEWHKKFTNLGLSIVCVTGDSDKIEFRSLLNYNLIISTPEKWDALTRKWRENEALVKVVKLFMIDEVHLLNADSRGSTLEVIVSRMKTVEINQEIRFIAASATVPNVEDVAEWIGHSSIKNVNTKCFKFPEEVRPVQLKKIVHGYPFHPQTQTAFKFDLYLNFRLQPLIMQYSEGKPTLIFCNTRKSVEMTAKFIVQHLKINLTPEQKQKVLDVSTKISDKTLREIIVYGFAFHHAGLLQENRHAIEESFRRGEIPVLVTTSALALGVNLPAHLVIIKNTKQYVPGVGVRDYDEIEILQMIGRAGRPQFDTSATAIILTTNEDKLKFERMVSSQQPIESNLHKHLTEHLNAEVVLRTITDLDVAMKWLASTFLYIRARKNPQHYNLPVGLDPDQIDKKILEIFQIHLNKLVRAGMLTMDQNINIAPTVTGQIMAKYYVDYETMKLFTQISGKEVMTQVLALISKCHEFSEMCIRSGDKKCLNFLNKNTNKQTIRFPLNGRIKTLDMKINCIIQAVMGNLEIYDQSILCDSLRIMRITERISKCLIEYLETRSNCYVALLNSIILAKCFCAKLWENSQYVSKQLSGIGNIMSHQLANAGKTSFSRILESNPRELEMILKRKAPTGNSLIEQVKYLPQYTMNLEKSKVNNDELILSLTLKNSNDLEEKTTVDVNSTMALLVGESNNNTILLYEKYTHSYLIQNPHVTKIIDIKDTQTDVVTASFISEDWVGIDCTSSITVNRLIEDDINVVTSKSDVKKNPTYMQMFLDMYMKSAKKNPQEHQKEKTNTSKGGKKEKSEQIPKVLKSVPKKAMRRPKSPTLKIAHPTQKNFENQEENTRELQNIERNNNALVSSATEKDDAKENITKSELNEKEENEIIHISSGEEILAEEELNNSLFSDKLSLNNFESEISKLVEVVQEDFKKQCDDLKNSAQKVTSSGGGAKKIVRSFNSTESTSPVLIRKTVTNNRVKEKPLIDNLSKINLLSIEQKYNRDKEINTAPNLNFKPQPVTPKFPVIKNLTVPAMQFEEMLMEQNEDNGDRINFDKYRINRRKFSHDIDPPDSTVNEKLLFHSGQILIPAKKSRVEPIPNDGSLQKSIKWRSPLVYSPPVKFTPKLSLESRENSEIQNDLGNETFETLNSASSRTTERNHRIRSTWHPGFVTEKQPTMFPLSDKECNDSPRNNFKEISEICSNSLFEEILNSKGEINNKKDKYKSSASACDYYISQPTYQQEKRGQTNQESTQKENLNFSQIDEHPSQLMRRPFPKMPQNKNMPLSQNVPQLRPQNEPIFNSPQDPRIRRNPPFEQHYRRNVLPPSELEFIDEFNNREPRYYYRDEPRRVLNPAPNRYFEDRSPYIYGRPVEYPPSYYKERFYEQPIYRQPQEYSYPDENRRYGYREMPRISPYFDRLNETNIIEGDIYEHRQKPKRNNSEDILEQSASQNNYYEEFRGPMLRHGDPDLPNMMKRNLSFEENERNLRMIEGKNDDVSRSFEERLDDIIETNRDVRNYKIDERNYRKCYDPFEGRRNAEQIRYPSQMSYGLNRDIRRPFNEKQYVMNKFLYSRDDE